MGFGPAAPPAGDVELDLAGTLSGCSGTVVVDPYSAELQVPAGTLAGCSGSVSVVIPPGIKIPTGLLAGCSGLVALERVPPIELEIPAGALDDVSGRVSFFTATEAKIPAGTLDGVSGSVSASYDNSVWRWTGSIVGSAAQAGAPTSTGWGVAHDESTSQPARVAARHQEGQDCLELVRARHGLLDTLPASVAARHQVATSCITSRSDNAGDLLRTVRPKVSARHQVATPLLGGVSSKWRQLPHGPRPTIVHRHQVATALFSEFRSLWNVGEPLHKHYLVHCQAGIVVWGWGEALPAPPVIPEIPAGGCGGRIVGGAPLRFGHLAKLQPDGQLEFGCLSSAPTIPYKKGYFMSHEIYVIRVSDQVEIPTSTLNLSFDADSWAWTFQCSVPGVDAAAMLAPVGGEPVILEIGIDGNIWHVLVEDWIEDRSFAKRSTRITGRSLTALLGAPYESPRSYAEGSARTMDQLADQEMPTGWSLNWDAANWLVPAGAWGYQGISSIQAVSQIAVAAGAILIPAQAGQELTVAPRYPVSPWDYGIVAADFAVPEYAITQISRRLAQEEQANAVYVHGAEVGGILARVYRTGTAGDRAASTVMDDLITHIDGARARGERVLCAQASPPEVRSVTFPLDNGDTFPLVGVGDLVEVGVSPAVRGIVAGVNVSVEKGIKVRQTITLGEDSPNAWSKFAQLMPSNPLLVGSILTDYGDGTTMVEMVSGGAMRVRGSGSVGDMVYVRGGRIEGDAPSLPAYSVDV